MQSDNENQTPADRSVGSLLRELMLELTSLVRNEAALAKAEVSQKVTQLERGVFSLVLAVVLLFTGVIGLMFAGIYGLGQIWPMWLSCSANSRMPTAVFPCLSHYR